MKKHILLIFCFVFSLYSQAQESTVISEGTTLGIITDRPTASASPTTVPFKTFQIETGGLYTSQKNRGIKTELLNFNNTLLRYGLLNRFELRLSWAVSENRETQGENYSVIGSGFEPLGVGAKVEITEEKGLLPDIGLLIDMSLPFLASEDYQPETTGVSFRFAFAHTINEKSGISYNLGAEWSDDSPEVAYIYTLSYGYGITDKLSAYVELYGNFPRKDKAIHNWDAGLIYLLNSNLQLDTTIGTGLSGNQDLLLSAGFSYSIPN